MKRILICPLNWGLGHASRCVPLIIAFEDAGFECIIAASGNALQFLKNTFPTGKFVDFPGYEMHYSEKGMNALGMLPKAAGFYSFIKKEKQFTKALVRKYKPQVLFSDNRYGVYHPDVYSILLSHQLNPRSPFLGNLFRREIHRLIGNFNACWVPDFAGENALGGEISAGKTLNDIHYIGPISRFEGPAEEESKTYDYLGLVSGPEKQRTVFENLLLDKFEESQKKCLLIRGLPKDVTPVRASANVEVMNFADGKKLAALIGRSEMVISRSGYSSIMDLCCLNAKAILVPTPGQSEQEYLAKRMKTKGWFNSLSQSELNLRSINQIETGAFSPPIVQKNNLRSEIKKLSETLS